MQIFTVTCYVTKARIICPLTKFVHNIFHLDFLFFKSNSYLPRKIAFFLEYFLVIFLVETASFFIFLNLLEKIWICIPHRVYVVDRQIFIIYFEENLLSLICLLTVRFAAIEAFKFSGMRGPQISDHGLGPQWYVIVHFCTCKIDTRVFF